MQQIVHDSSFYAYTQTSRTSSNIYSVDPVFLTLNDLSGVLAPLLLGQSGIKPSFVPSMLNLPRDLGNKVTYDYGVQGPTVSRPLLLLSGSLLPLRCRLRARSCLDVASLARCCRFMLSLNVIARCCRRGKVGNPRPRHMPVGLQSCRWESPLCLLSSSSAAQPLDC